MSPARRGGGSWWASERGTNYTPPAATGAGSRRPFGNTWWGKAWIDALEGRVTLDANRLSRGRSYARRGTVENLQPAPGLVLAKVQGSRREPYTVTLRFPRFTADEWDRVLDVIAGRIGHTAALLDGELPPEIADDVIAAGVDLLPGPGDLKPSCSCPDYADPCKHSAAVCFVIADLLDQDPFVLLQLRGQSRDEVLAGLRARRMTSRSGELASDLTYGKNSPVASTAGLLDQGEGIQAKELFARDSFPDVPSPPMPPVHPGRPATLAVDPPIGSEFTADELSALAADAIGRAWDLATGGTGHLDLSYDQDLARRASRVVGTPRLTELAKAAGLPARELTGWAIAWREGGAGGLTVLRDQWDPPDEWLAEGRSALAAVAESGQSVGVRRNRVTSGKRQLRLGPDGLWYPFVKSFNTWDLGGPPSPDPQSLCAR